MTRRGFLARMLAAVCATPVFLVHSNVPVEYLANAKAFPWTGPPAKLQSFSELLKELYPQGLIESMLYKESPLLKLSGFQQWQPPEPLFGLTR